MKGAFIGLFVGNLAYFLADRLGKTALIKAIDNYLNIRQN